MSDLKIILLIIAGIVCFICITEFSYITWVRPNKFTFDETDEYAYIRYRWLKKQHFYLLLIALILLGVIPEAIYRDSARAAKLTLHFDTLMLIILCIVFLYAVATGIFNSTVLLITGKTLVVLNQPLPTWRSLRNATYEVSEVYYKKEYSYQKTDLGWVYRFFAKTDKGQTIKVLDAVGLEEAALQIDQSIQKQLGKSPLEQNAAKTDARSYIDKLRGHRR